MRRGWLASSLAVLCASAAFGAPAPARTARSGPAAVYLDESSPAARASAAAGIEALGGRVLHAFDDVLVVELPVGGELRAQRLPGVLDVAMNGTATAPRRRGSGPSFGRAAWKAIAKSPNAIDRGSDAPGPIEDDALAPPEVSLETVRALSRTLTGGPRGALSSATAATLSVPFGATALNTSEFLAGAVSVNIVLVESDGTLEAQSESWSSTRETEVVSAIAAGLEWIRLQEPQAALRFVYHVIPGRTDPRARTGYEPIRHAADPLGTTGEDRWATQILAKLGYASGDRFARSRALAADTRSADGTDWAVNVFVVDSLADTDGKFTDGRFAYCFIGGPHLVMTYDNQAWGISRMDMVLRHELLHAFYAFDEYTASGCDCTSHRGYLDGANVNCTACNPVAAECVMISNGDSMCDATRRHLGWADLDGDGAIDVIGQDPDTFLDAIPANLCSAPVVSGLVTVVAATNRNTFPGTTHPSISVNRISGVQFRVDGSPWALAEPAGGNWDAAQAHFSAAPPSLPLGSHHLEVRAVDDFGNQDASPDVADVVIHGAVAAMGETVRAARSGVSGLSISWGACAGATIYRIYRRTTPSSAAALVTETSQTTWSSAGATSGYYEIRQVDACGGERSD